MGGREFQNIPVIVGGIKVGEARMGSDGELRVVMNQKTTDWLQTLFAEQLADGLLINPAIRPAKITREDYI